MTQDLEVFQVWQGRKASEAMIGVDWPENACGRKPLTQLGIMLSIT